MMPIPLIYPRDNPVVALKRFLLLCPLLFCTTAIGSAAVLELKGAAVYEELGRELFVAGLYLSTSEKDPRAIQASLSDRRMELHIINPIARRRWINLWMQSIAINNSPETISRWAPDLLEIFDAHKGDLDTGDIVVIEYGRDQGTKFQINGTTLVAGKAKTVFDLFLSAWLGIVPPSTDFRLGLLGEKGNKAALQERMRSISPGAERRQAIAKWPKAPDQPRELRAEPPETLAQVHPDPDSTGQGVTKINTASDTGPPKTASTSPGEEAPNVATGPSAAAEAVEPLRIATVSDSSTPTAGDEMSLASILAQQKYVHHLMIKIYESIHYPATAIRRNQQGSVRLIIHLHRDGSVAEIAFAEKAPFPALNREAKRAAEAAAPYNSAPDNLPGDVLEFTIPIAFRLAE